MDVTLTSKVIVNHRERMFIFGRSSFRTSFDRCGRLPRRMFCHPFVSCISVLSVCWLCFWRDVQHTDKFLFSTLNKRTNFLARWADIPEGWLLLWPKVTSKLYVSICADVPMLVVLPTSSGDVFFPFEDSNFPPTMPNPGCSLSTEDEKHPNSSVMDVFFVLCRTQNIVALS